MIRIHIDHETTYRYAQPVRFEPHQLMVRPREGHDLRIEQSNLAINVPHQIRWLRDIYDNSIARVHFHEPAELLSLRSRVEVIQYNLNPLDFLIDSYAWHYPFLYSPRERPDLIPYQLTIFPQQQSALRSWMVAFWKPGQSVETLELLTQVNRAIHQQMRYQRREESGVQSPEETLALQSGSCRDLAVLLMEACRCWGLASRFVSGYLLVPEEHASTHAWAEIYLPGAGWKGFDPTHGTMADANHVPVAVSRHPEGAAPVSGAFIGPVEAFLSMEVKVRLRRGDTERVGS